MSYVGTYATIETGGWFRSDTSISTGFLEIMSDGWWTSFIDISGVLSISANPDQGRLPLTTNVTASSSTPLELETLQWYVNDVPQPLQALPTKIRLTFTVGGVYTIKLIASDIFGGGPLIATTAVLVTSTISVIDSAVLLPDPNRIMALEGTANITHVSKVGVGVSAKIVSNFVNTGFTHEEGPNLIFS